MKGYRIGYWYGTRCEKLYVASLPTKQYGECGKPAPDYGYDTDPSKAIDLSPYWQRRFRKYLEDCGSQQGARFEE